MGSTLEQPTAASAEAAGGSWTCSTCHHVYPADFAVCPRDATPRSDGHSPTPDPLVGEVLGRTYRIARVLGEGGMARLYEAEHLRIDARFAVKVIHDDLSRDPDLLARFEREARAAGRIHSEHVVRMVDVLRTPDNRPCLVTELLEGEDLQALLDRVGKLAVADAIPIARQICQAVAAAHAVGVVHRDLKPANVFLCQSAGGEPPLVKVFDFGVAKLEDDDKLTRTDAVMGTAAYMAPEQARRAADAGPLSDVYSTSAVLYHMLCGQPPYGNVPAFSRLALVLHEEPARPRSLEPSIPDGIEAVIQQAMARDRQVRIQTAVDLEAQLAAFDQPPPIAASPTPTPMPRARNMITGGNPAIATSSGSLAAVDPMATQIVVRARLARPLAAMVALASSLAAGAWIAALLGVLIAPTSGGEHALIGVIAVGAVLGVGFAHLRALRPSWASAPAVLRHIRSAARALVAGGLTFGALELAVQGTLAVFGAPALGVATRLGLAGAAAALGLGWQTLRLGDRLRRRIG
ncbi:MAG TPA: serine/threonine-protein kinase [Kofleriaceae bacterium]|jgi:serine/threonine-protein kinase|nr:serine/threonine-protein kinase [Kofleriaceae bacterium]